MNRNKKIAYCDGNTQVGIHTANGVTDDVVDLVKCNANSIVSDANIRKAKEILRLLKINSNNLNQYVKKANETGSIYYEDIMELKKSQGDILQKMGCVLDRLSGIM